MPTQIAEGLVVRVEETLQKILHLCPIGHKAAGNVFDSHIKDLLDLKKFYKFKNVIVALTRKA